MFKDYTLKIMCNFIKIFFNFQHCTPLPRAFGFGEGRSEAGEKSNFSPTENKIFHFIFSWLKLNMSGLSYRI